MKPVVILLIFFTGYHVSTAQSIEVIDPTQLIKSINYKSPKIKVFNFWAAWFKPCVKEWPYLKDMNLSEKADVILISLDFTEDLDTMVTKFISAHDLTSKVCLLDNVDYNSWLNLVDISWAGSIPATLLINSNSGNRKFIENHISPGDLDHLLIEPDN